MIKSYFLTALRNILKSSKTHSLLNIIGLGIGFSCALLISFFVFDEYSYDRYHTNHERIFRVVHNWTNEMVTPWARTSAPLGPALKSYYPEIEQMTRVRKNPRTDLLEYGEKEFYEERLYFADSTFFEVFSFKLNSGNPKTALQNVNSILLTERMAEKYFDDEDPIGKIIRYNNSLDLMVTGILEEVPSNSHFTFDFLVTFSSLKDVIGNRRLEHWAWFDHHTYILMEPNTKVAEFEASLPEFMKANTPEWLPERMILFLQPLASIHLHSDLKDELLPNSNPKYSFILITVAIFILGMAIINFMNLATARYASRSVEIGIRKVMGAHRGQLISYYLLESVTLSTLSFVFAIVLLILLLPWFNNLSGKEIQFFSERYTMLVSAMFLLSILVGLFSGSYPAFFLSRLKPVKVLKGTFVPGKSTTLIRKGLVVFQFTISILMIIATLVVSFQLNYFNTTSLGFSKDRIIVVPIKDRTQNSRYSAMVNEIKNHAAIEAVSYSSSTPGAENNMTFSFRKKGDGTDSEAMATFFIDENFLSLYEINILDGDYITDKFMADSTLAMIINESAAKYFDLKDPIGQQLDGSFSGTIIAVIEDFNFKSLHNKMEPLVIAKSTNWFRQISIRIKAGQAKEAISYLESKWPELYGQPLEYSFLNENIKKLYIAEEKLSRTFKFFAGIALAIAALGLIGLGTFTVEKRSKEIGIRKVLGGSSSGIVGLFYFDFLKLIVISAVIALPLSHFIMKNWLESFAFRITPGVDIYLIPILLLTILLAISIGYQTLKASLANPVNSLRDE